jgi:hypothetical protein
MKHAHLFLGIVLSFSSLQAEKMKLTRVILAVNESDWYLGFWEAAAKSWKQIIGITPTLALIANESIQIDESLGEVIRFAPIEGLPSAYPSQVIRLLLPALYPDEICLVSDIDHIAVGRDYFHNTIANIEDDQFVFYREYPPHERIAIKDRGLEPNQWPMCYCAAKGSTFAEIFDIRTKSIEAIREKLEEWGKTEYPRWQFYTDQVILYQHVTQWKEYQSRVTRIGHNWITGRMHRHQWNKIRIKNRSIIDIALKPYTETAHLVAEAMHLLDLK